MWKVLRYIEAIRPSRIRQLLKESDELHAARRQLAELKERDRRATFTFAKINEVANRYCLGYQTTDETRPIMRELNDAWNEALKEWPQ